jgi:drug/metabolite transporter (DMT)-like permease
MGFIRRIPPLYRAIIIILFGIFAFDLMGVFVRILGKEFPIFQISVMRNIFGVIPPLLLVLAARSMTGLHKICTPYLIGLCAFRGITVIFAQISYYTALSHIAFATATTLAFAGPMFITALSVPGSWASGRVLALERCYTGFCRSYCYYAAGGRCF